MEYRSGPEVVRVLRGASLRDPSRRDGGPRPASGVGKSTAPASPRRARPADGGVCVLWEGEDLFQWAEADLVPVRPAGGFVFQFYNLLAR